MGRGFGGKVRLDQICPKPETARSSRDNVTRFGLHIRAAACPAPLLTTLRVDTSTALRHVVKGKDESDPGLR